jgi:hypothetical protein
MVKNAKNLTMVLIHYELPHPTVKSWKNEQKKKSFRKKTGVLEVEIGKNGPGILGVSP